MKHQFLCAASVLLGSPFMAGSVHAASADQCASLIQENHVVGIKIVANGYTGWLGGEAGQGGPQQQGLLVKRLADGTFQFEGDALFDGESATKVKGTCKGRKIQFTRTGSGWAQSYSGFLHERRRSEKTYTVNPMQSCGGAYVCMAEQTSAVGQEMSGLFGPLKLVNMKPKVDLQFGWCAHMVAIEQIR